MAPSAQINTAGPMPEFSWTAGKPYPVVNGKTVPPPTAPPSKGVPPPTTGGHFYAGSAYTGTSHTATWMWTEVTIPSASPLSSEFYYVILSAWDNKASYDQIGFANSYGVWGLAYSYTTGYTTSCTGTITYHYSADAKGLTAGQLYAFAMTTEDGPGTWLEAYTVSSTGTTTLIWSLHAPTGATNPGLTVQQLYCDYYDYTDYQETYGTTSSSYPNAYGASYGLTFYFTVNQWGTGTGGPPWTATSWIAWSSSAPSFNYATISGSNVNVYN